ncbi:uncharacterized protein LOC132451243 isoform X1 [Gadus macrocephalus]|uniref:uncharacterized protein LOC132451243 isoform X1 n=1 Tax=Gadus macrocephalus TaxID=80720 RepID=UPI0028CBC052|nr:uncharacterized protein LOC132451243 isoform X1 [Gadus macrocephalus]
MQRHVSVIVDGESPEIQLDSSGLHHCPFCRYKGSKCDIDHHIKCHASVKYRGLQRSFQEAGREDGRKKRFQDKDLCTKRARVAPTASSSEGSDKTEDQELEPGNLEDDVVLKDTIQAAAWCQLQSFKDRVSHPEVIGMEGWEQMAASTQRKSHDGGDEEETWKPFLFSFRLHTDYELFCVEMMDRRNLKVFASFESNTSPPPRDA